ncbi:hypothetical protein BC938DRAFT_476860 [Jimgerdemannia flammicorona]|uniref:Uncharacterized protein n=1 Tax=Jimgerdemannia flammicorona TaxID=994334 RepID=A0A433QQ06_9FUNG|nr:hypothetical protein BC938DRAFT_476860 [Jimgerdemannia flammicorona]
MIFPRLPRLSWHRRLLEAQAPYGLPGYEFGTVFLVVCYVPNADQGLSRLGERGVFEGHMEKRLREREGRSFGYAVFFEERRSRGERFGNLEKMTESVDRVG